MEWHSFHVCQNTHEKNVTNKEPHLLVVLGINKLFTIIQDMTLTTNNDNTKVNNYNINISLAV